MVNLIIFGPPGSGKGTYASRLQLRLNVDVIATGDLFREIMRKNTVFGKKVRSYVQKGSLVPDDITIEVLKKRLTEVPNGKGFILDGYPRTMEQAKALEKIAKIDAIIHLIVPDRVIIERLSARRICKDCSEVYNLRYLKPKIDMTCDKCGGPLYQRIDDTPEVIKKRIEIYERQTEPLLQYYREKGVTFIEFKCEKIDVPPKVAVGYILKGLRKLKLA